MPRGSRLIVDGGYYHIITRGIDRRQLFRYRQDYETFLKLIREYKDKHKVYIFNYCLMPNHIHLLLKPEKAPGLPKFMQLVLQVYASQFRRKYKSTGFVFQNRYKSRLIDNDAYLLECARYIERNPLRARIVSELSQYRWSSFSYYAYGRQNDIITLPNPLFLELARENQARQEAYISYVLQERPYDLIVDKAFRIR